MLSEHHISFPGTNWTMWRWFAVRGTGFPVSQVLQLSMPDYAQAVDFWLDCEAEVEQVQQQIYVHLSEEGNGAEGKAINWPLLKAARRIKQGKELKLSPALLSIKVQALMEKLKKARDKRDQARIDLERHYRVATVQTLQALADVAQDGPLREAVIWQNRHAVREGFDPFLRTPITANPPAQQRRHARLIAKYLQRYCTKNDSIGFFGPVCWGRWVVQNTDITVRPGPHLLAKRSVYLETWSIDALGEVLAQQGALLPWAVPRPLPFLWLSDTFLHVPFARPLQLSVAQATVFAACDGLRTARDIAQAILPLACPGLKNEADVFAVLNELLVARRITWGFEVSIEDWSPERTLRQRIERITSPSLRQDALKPLEQLEAARRTVEAAAGNVEQLDKAFEHLESTFTQLTDRAATRDAGKTYAARTLIYEDCLRDLDLTLGSSILKELAPPLTLLLTSARWFSYTTARFYRKAFQKKYSELVQKTGSSTVDFATYWSWVQSLIPMVPGQLLARTLLSEFQKRWATILRVPAGQRRVHYTSQELQARVQEIFQAPHAGWRSACYHSPDLLIAATSLEAILRDDYTLVLGEFHQGVNTLDANALLAQHPVLSDLWRTVEIDQPEPKVVPVYSRHTLPTKRTHGSLVLEQDWRLVFGTDSACVPQEQALPIGMLVLEEHEGEVIVRTRDGSKQFDLLEVFDGLLSAQICNSFKLLPPALHRPRITVDRLIIHRETWSFAPADLAWTLHSDPLECYIDGRRWARMHEIPRFFFARVPGEIKPLYVDLDSPISVDIFARTVRQEGSAKGELITISEMLPDPEHAWLPDAEANRYTCEIRMVAVDQKKPPVNNVYRVR